MVARVGSWWFVVSDVSSWCPRGGSWWLVVAHGVGGVLVVSSCWLVVSEVSSVLARGVGGVLRGIYAADHPDGHTQDSSVRRRSRL